MTEFQQVYIYFFVDSVSSEHEKFLIEMSAFSWLT